MKTTSSNSMPALTTTSKSDSARSLSVAWNQLGNAQAPRAMAASSTRHKPAFQAGTTSETAANSLPQNAEKMISDIFQDALSQAIEKAVAVLESLKNGDLRLSLSSSPAATPVSGEIRVLSTSVSGGAGSANISSATIQNVGTQGDSAMTGPSSSSSSGASSGQEVLSSRNGFLWKPVSENNGKLVVLLPPTLTGKVKSAAIYSSLPPSAQNLLEDGKFSGDHQNGGRSHFRFSKPGGSYPDGAFVVAQLKDGTFTNFQIKDSSARNT